MSWLKSNLPRWKQWQIIVGDKFNFATFRGYEHIDDVHNWFHCVEKRKTFFSNYLCLVRKYKGSNRVHWNHCPRIIRSLTSAYVITDEPIWKERNSNTVLNPSLPHLLWKLGIRVESKLLLQHSGIVIKLQVEYKSEMVRSYLCMNNIIPWGQKRESRFKSLCRSCAFRLYSLARIFFLIKIFSIIKILKLYLLYR